MSDKKNISESTWQGLPDTRYWENMHIPLWLLKDTCWMLEWRWMGVTMVIPTILTALYILMRSKNLKRLSSLNDP